jgi:AcrR family transcriptional regulator
MNHPARTIRALAEDLPEARPFLQRRDQQRHDLIRAVGRRAFAELGPGGFSIKDFANAVWMSVTRFTHYYCDLESLLADLIETHLMDLYAAIGNIPSNTPDRPAAHRAAYFAATRTHRGGLTQSHLLLLHARRSLPPDLREPLEQLRDRLGEVMAPGHAEAALSLLDSSDFAPAEIEAMFATLTATRQASRETLHAQLQLPLNQPDPDEEAAPEQEAETETEAATERARQASFSRPSPQHRTPLSELLTLTRSMANVHAPDRPSGPTHPPPRRPRPDRQHDPDPPPQAFQATADPT